MTSARGRRLRFVAVALGTVLLCGCAAPLQTTNPPSSEESKEKPVSVRLPALSPFKIETPPTVPPPDEAVTPSDVQDGIARSMKLFEFSYTRGKPGPPVKGGVAPVDEAGPASEMEAVPDVERP